jgi:hypothetical protein
MTPMKIPPNIADLNAALYPPLKLKTPPVQNPAIIGFQISSFFL